MQIVKMVLGLSFIESAETWIPLPNLVFFKNNKKCYFLQCFYITNDDSFLDAYVGMKVH